MAQPTVRSLVALVITLGRFTNTALGQGLSRPHWPTWEMRAQLGFLRLYEGDATVGAVSTRMPSAGVGYRLPVLGRRPVIEASFGHVGQDHDPYNRAPAFTLGAVLLRHALLPSSVGVEPFLTVGLGRLKIDVEEVVCEPPTCFREGGPNFVDGTFTTFIGGAGIIVPLARWGALRGDLRRFKAISAGPNAGDSGAARLELAAGFILRW